LRKEFRYNLYGDLTWWAEWVIQTTVGIKSPHHTQRKVARFETKDEAMRWLRKEAKDQGVSEIPGTIAETKVWLPLGIIHRTP
jgi:hypothetical protein